MASRAVWKGSVSIGMVSLPVSAFVAAQSRDSSIQTKLLHAECKTPHKQKKWCPTCEKEVPQTDLVKGMEVSPGKWVTFSAEEIDAIQPETSHTISITAFVEAQEIDPLFYRGGYYLAPQAAGAGQPYAMIREAMLSTGRVAIGTWTSFGRDHVIAIRPQGEILVMHLLHLKEEIRPASETSGLAFAQGIHIDKKQLKLAEALVDMFADTFDPTVFEDSYAREFKALLQAKVDGRIVEKTEAKPKTQVTDFMAALEQSLQAGKPAKKKMAKAEAAPAKRKKAS